MSRFQDATSSWFMIGDDPDKLSGTIEIDLPDAPKWRWPAILMGAAGISAIAVGTILLLGHRAGTSAPPPLQIAVARSVPAPMLTPPPGDTSAPMLAPPPAAPVEESQADEPAQPAATPAPAAPEAQPVKAETPKPSAKPEPAAKPEPKLAKKAPKKLVGKPQRKPRKAKQAKAGPAAHEIINGEKLMKQRKYGAALEQFQHLLRYTPDDVRALRGACAALDELGRRNDAARVCRRALNLEPDDLETRSTLARIYYSGGAYQWSANEWRRVLSARPHDSQAKKGLREAQARL